MYCLFSLLISLRPEWIDKIWSSYCVLSANLHYLIYITYFILSKGAIREAGGSFGKKEKAEEDQFFRRQQQEQLKKLKEAEASRETQKKQVSKKE